MNCALHVRVAMVVLCSVSVFGQSSPPPPDSSGGTHGRQLGALDILSDTQGIDFGPYLQGILQHIKANWYLLIPESVAVKKGKLAIEFAIRKDGHVAGMKLFASS